MVSAGAAQASTSLKCGYYPGVEVIDGNTYAGDPADIGKISIEGNCIIRNFPAPEGLGTGTATINFNLPTGVRAQDLFLVFDNVHYNGTFACANIVQYINVWWVNGSYSTGRCTPNLVPVDSIVKQVPSGQTTATIGVPFTYTLTLPVMMKWMDGELTEDNPYTDENPLYDVHIYDNLTPAGTGADLQYIGYTAYFTDAPGTPVTLTEHHDAGSDQLHFSIAEIPAHKQLVIEIEVVLRDNPTVNVAGTSFYNTASWDFYKLYLGQLRQLPGENGISETLIIAGPQLVLDKWSPVTNLNLNGIAPFDIKVQNAGYYDAWNAAITDVLPDGMCETSPLATMTAQIFAGDDAPVTGVLTLGTHYTATYSGCTLTVMLTDAVKLAPNQYLLIKYDAKFDPNSAPSGAYTNYAGATDWYNDASTNTERKHYTSDIQDSHTINAAVVGYYLLKSVENRTTGETPSTNTTLSAYPGDTLRYTLQVQNFTLPALSEVSISDDLGKLTPGLIVPGSLTLVPGSSTLPAGAVLTVNPNGGTGGVGSVTITNLNMPSDTAKTGIVYQVQFEITVGTPTTTPDTLSNQADLLAGWSWDEALEMRVDWTGVSDDPYVDGPARLGDAEATFHTTDAIINKPGPLSKTVNQPSATIGEHFTYTLNVPAEPTPVRLYDVRVTDDLSVSAADLSYVSARWKQPDGAWRVLSNAGTNTVPVLYDPVTGIDVPIGGQAEIELTVELVNTSTNQETLGSFINSATYSYNRANGLESTRADGEGDSSGSMTIVEPTLEASKIVQFAAPAGKTTSEPAMVGDVLEYAVTLTNTGTSPAYDLSVADMLPPGVVLDGTFAPTATIGGVPVEGFNPEPSMIGAATVWGSDNGDGALDVGMGQSLVLTYRVTVMSVSGDPIQNSVYADWSSLDGGSASERTGADCLAGVPSGLNDYCVSAMSQEIATADNTRITKAAVLDTYAEPVAGDDPIVRVGDTVTYELTLNLQEYTTRGVVVTDVLPQGMRLESFSIVPGGTTFNYTMVSEPTAPSEPGATLTWDFGDIYNVPSNNGTPVDPLVIRYVAKVVTDAPTTGVDYTTSILRDNTATLTYIGGDPAVYPERLTSAERIEVRQPAMSTVAKTGVVVPNPARTVIGNGSSATPFEVLVASDTMSFQIQSCNNGLAPAYGVQITDALDSEFDAATISGLTVSANGGTLTEPVDYAYALSGNTMSFTLVTPVEPGQCVTVDYSVRFRSDVAANSLWSNNAQLPEYASLPADGRPYTSTDTAQVWMTNTFPGVTPSKTVNVTEAVIGQEVAYTIVIPAGNAARSNVVIDDPLDPRLEYLGFTSSSTDPSAPAVTYVGGSNVRFNVTQIPAGVETMIVVNARVRNSLDAQAGALTNVVSYSYDGSNLATVPLTASVSFNIVEPTIAVQKTVPASEPKAGDTLTYTVTLAAAGGAAGDLFSDARDVTVVDTLGAGLAYVAGSATLGGAPFADPSVSGQTLTWNVGHITEGTTPILTYQVKVPDSVGAGQLLRNDVRVEWTSLVGASMYERTGTGTPAYNDYFATAFTELYTLMPDAPSKAAAKPTATIGEQFTYYVTLPSATTVADTALYDVTAYDNLAATGADLKFVSAALDTTGTGTGPWTPLTNSGTDTNLVIGTAGGIDIPAGGKVVVGITVEMLDTANNTRGDTYSNTAYYTYNTVNNDPSTSQTSIPSTPASMTIVEPLMSPLTKVDLGTRIGSGTFADPYQVNVVGDTMQFRLSSCNTAGDSPAYNVLVTDTLAPEFNPSSIGGIAVSVGGAPATYNYVLTGSTMSFTLTTPVNPGQCVTVDYTVGFNADVAPNSKWANQASLPTYASLETNGRTYTTTETAQVWMTNTFPGVTPTKTVDVTEAVIGQEVAYTIVIPAANAALSNVVIDDPLDARLEYIGFTSSDATATLETGSNLRFHIPQIPAGQETTLTVRARVANVLDAQAGTVNNVVSYSYTGSNLATVPLTATVSLNIIESAIDVSKVASNLAPAIGETLTYTVTLTSSGGAAGDLFSDPRDVKIVDTLGLGLVYVAGSATLDGAPFAPGVSGNGTTTQQVLTWDTGLDITEGTAPVLTYQVTVHASVGAGQLLRNDVRVEWTSLDGASGFERTGTGTTVDDLNNYFATAFTEVRTPLTVNFAKSVVNATTGQDPGANATPGDTLHYQLTVTNTNVVPLTTLQIQDVLAAEFAAGTLQGLTVSDPSATATANATGGANGTGLVTVQLASLAAGATLTIDFDVTLRSVIQSGTHVLNQATLAGDGLPATTSDQTDTLIAAAPLFRVQKTSQDMTGEVNVLRAGDTLRYTITVKNIGTENATGVTLRDIVPTYTTYVAGTTRLNGVLVADPSAGVSALQAGMLINATENTTPGAMRADAGTTTANVATITFDVRVNSDVLDGTIISNQGFVAGAGVGSGTFPEQPSDDPGTTTPDDPTRDIVGYLPLLDATKTVALTDNGTTPDSVDQNDYLTYTITVYNTSAIVANDVTLTDAVPEGTVYLPGTTTLNGASYPDAPGGVSPLEAGIQIGPIAANGSVTVTFQVQVTASTPGTVISNQGYVSSPGLATEPTDADGNDANGDQPTVVVVGSAQQLAIVKAVADLNGGLVLAGDLLEYTVVVTNTGTVTATNVIVSDNFASVTPYAVYQNGTASFTANGSTTSLTPSGTTLTASAITLAPGATATLRFRVLINGDVATGTRITNTGRVDWNMPAVWLESSASVDVGSVPGTATLTGKAWHDTNFDNLYDGGENPLAGWTVELYRSGTRLGATTTDASGGYSFVGVAPTTTADSYEVRFTAPGATATTAKLGLAHSQFSTVPFTDSMQRISGITVSAGTVPNLNLPIDPNGVVFDSITRSPIAGARLTMVQAGSTTEASSTCFDDPAQQNQVTLASGFYKFDLKASCVGDYVIKVTPPGSGYVAGPSRIIPPLTSETTPAFSVPSCSPDAVPTTTNCEAMATASAPDAAVQPSQITHYLHLTLGDPAAGDNQIYNNHIAVDRSIVAAFSISKTSALVNVSRGQLVPYTITINNTLGADLTGMSIVDTFPPGFKYVEGSSRVDGVAVEPAKTNRNLTWNNLQVANGAPLTIRLLFIVGSGVSEGDYVNRAQVFHPVLGAASSEATATVRVIPDPNFDCTDVIGKVFDDVNRNGYQDAGEKGLPGVRVVSARGLLITTDDHGRFHVTCAVVPDENRGSNFILKVDDRTLPTGYRITTENPRVQRATRGKMMKFNFGAAINKIVRIDIANGVFEPDTTEMRIQWKPRMDLLMGELKKAPSILRLAYMAEVEDEKLVEARLKAMKQEIEGLWAQQSGAYELVIETEVFWRLGAPPSRSKLK